MATDGTLKAQGLWDYENDCPLAQVAGQPGPGPHRIPDPNPTEFSNAQVATDPILHFFHYSHLPPKLQETPRSFFILAAHVINTLPRNPERTVALRKLLEAKDAAVRANIEVPSFATPKQPLASISPIGEPREIGGHDDDRDGPIPFES